jgi:hypothetical protein
MVDALARHPRTVDLWRRKQGKQMLKLENEAAALSSSSDGGVREEWGRREEEREEEREEDARKNANKKGAERGIFQTEEKRCARSIMQ